jgi:glyoxylase-like metal-dependent hydrolase (beta-lactamase superfamily II)
MQKLAKDIYVETSFPGVTVGAILTPEGILCIDTPTHPSDARRWRLKLAQLSPKPVQLIINLDHHRDRVLGNTWFDAPAIAHEQTYERVRLLSELFKGSLSDAGADADLAADLAGVRIVLPQVTFADEMTLVKGGRETRLVHRPGSAPGAIWVEIPDAQIVFTGDAVTNDVPPFMHDADLEAWLENLAGLQKKKYPAKTIVPGRGALTDKKGVKETASFLKVVRRKMHSLVRARKSRLDAALTAPSYLEYFTVPSNLRDHYTRRLRAGLEHVYESLAGPGCA